MFPLYFFKISLEKFFGRGHNFFKVLGKGKIMEEIEAKVKKIISEQLGIEEDKITLDSHFQDDLEADSLDTVELIMAFEEEFNITIPEEMAEKITTVRSAIESIQNEL